MIRTNTESTILVKLLKNFASMRINDHCHRNTFLRRGRTRKRCFLRLLSILNTLWNCGHDVAADKQQKACENLILIIKTTLTYIKLIFFLYFKYKVYLLYFKKLVNIISGTSLGKGITGFKHERSWMASVYLYTRSLTNNGSIVMCHICGL